MRSVQSLGGIPFTIEGNRSWTGFQTFAAGVEMDGVAGANTTLKLRAVTGQTGHLLEMYNQSGDLVVFYAQDGTLNSNAPQNYTGGSAFTQNSATAIGLSVKRFSSGATGNLQEWQDENGLALLKITSSGGIQSAAGGLSVNSLGIGVTSASGAIEVVHAPDVTAHYGTVNIGNGAWDGSTSGHFVGSGSGTILAINTATGYASSLVDFQVAGTSKFKLDASGNVTLPGNVTPTGLIDFTNNASLSVPTSNLSGFRVRLHGNAGTDADMGIGADNNNLWLNTGSGGLVSFYVAGTRVGLFQAPGTTERASSVNLSLPRTPSTQAQGVAFSNGVAYDAVILRTANDDFLRFGFDSGGSFTERLLLSPSGVLTIDPAGSNIQNQPYQGSAINFGTASSGEGISSTRSGNNLHGLDFWTNNAIRFAIHNTGTVYLGGSSNSATLAVNPVGDNNDPTSGAWARSDGTGGFILEPSGSGNLYFAWSNPQEAHFGGAVEIKGALTVDGGSAFAGQATFNGGATFSGAASTPTFGNGLTVTGGPASFHTSVQIQSGASIYSGTGAPGFSATTGSIYMQIDGSGAHLWVNKGGTSWGSVAGT